MAELHQRYGGEAPLLPTPPAWAKDAHVAPDAKDAHALTLMSGVRAEDGRGADIVISEFTDLLPLVKHFEETDAKTPPTFPKNLLDGLKAKYYLP